MQASDEAKLDNPMYAALTGPHAALAERRGRALRYPTAMCPFLALPSEPDPQDWRDAHALVAPDGIVGMMRTPVRIGATWAVQRTFKAVQMVLDGMTGTTAPTMTAPPEIAPLGATDVPEMAALVAETKPGPFFERTVELGAYYGIRHEGRLVAMAGERMHLGGWTEVSAVCTDPSHRGQGLASLLVQAVVAGIAGRSERAFLHTTTDNARAIRVYESLGFRIRRELTGTLISPRS